jgi:hypothetical protein
MGHEEHLTRSSSPITNTTGTQDKADETSEVQTLASLRKTVNILDKPIGITVTTVTPDSAKLVRDDLVMLLTCGLHTLYVFRIPAYNYIILSKGLCTRDKHIRCRDTDTDRARCKTG